jgi:hypothetical protein
MNWLWLFLFLSTFAFGKQITFDDNDFEGMMGSSTSHWRHIASDKDLELLERSKMIFQKHKMGQHAQKGHYKTPSVVHFIWLGPRPFPPESVENVRSWIAAHPAWTVKFWTDRDRDPPCEGMEKHLVKDFQFLKLGKCFEESQNWGEKSDLLRYEILFQQGGVYADHDVECVKSFVGMHRGYDFFCALETPHEPFVGRGVTCGNGIFGSRPRHPVMAAVIDLIAERWEALGEKFRGKDAYSRTEVVMQRTYIAMTEAVEKAIGLEDNVDVIFPAAYFFAKSGMVSIYTRHLFAGAWDESKIKKTGEERAKERMLGKIRRKNQNIFLLLTGLVFLNGSILWVKIFKRRKA